MRAARAGPDAATAARLAARRLVTYATPMGPVSGMLRTHGYQGELDALLAENPGSADATVPAAAERLARDVLLHGTYDEATDLISAWSGDADELSLVAAFGVPAEKIMDVIEVIA